MPHLARAVAEGGAEAEKTGERVREAIDGMLGIRREAGAPLPEASPATKGQCNDERACGACFSGQGQCETAAPATVHPDDAAVDALAAAMKEKLARQRAKGYGGWDTDCTQQRLSELLRGHVDKGDPVDVANFCAFLLARGEGIAAAPPSIQLTPTDMQWAEDLIRQLPENHEGRNSWLLNYGSKRQEG